MTTPFVWGSGGSKDTLDNRRRMAEALLKSGSDYSPVAHPLQGIARVAQALTGAMYMKDADATEKASNESFANSLAAYLGGGGTAAAPATDGAQPGSGNPQNALDAIMKFESGGKNVHQNIVPAGGGFNPSTGTVTGPSSAQGFFQMITPTWLSAAKSAGIDTGQYPTAMAAPYDLQRKAASALFAKEGFAPWAPYNAALRSHIAKNGGAGAFFNDGAGPTQVADLPAPGASPVSMETGQPGFAVPPGPAPAMTGATFNAITAGQPLEPAFQSEGLTQPWMGSALPPAQPEGPQMVQAPLPPARPNDLADIPAAGAVPAIGQMSPAAPAGIDPNSNDAGARFTAGGGNGDVPAVGSDSGFMGLARALGGNGSAPPAASPAVQNVAQAVAPQAAAAPAPNSMGALAVALIRSGNVKEGVALAQEAMKPVNGVTMGDRLVDPRTGRVIADFTGANGGKSKSYGLNPLYGTDAQGNVVMLQAGDKGDAVATKLPEGVKLATGVERVDLGTSWGLMDKRTGQMVGTLPKDIAGTKVEEAKGTAQGAAVTGLTDALAKAQQTLDSIAGVRNHPGREGLGATGSSASWPVIGNGIPGRESRDFVARVDQLKGQAFLEAFNQLKGGGAISEVEGKTATAALARLDRAQSKEGFDAALDDLEKIIRSGMERARQKAGVAAPAQTGNDGGWQDVGGIKIRKKQ